MTKKALVAFSGGIDSCRAVALLRSEGYHIVALYIDMLGQEDLVEQARRSAFRVGAELHIIDAREQFARNVEGYFFDEYMAGRTPAPCTRCNSLIKWRILCETADRLNIEFIATGHYFQIEILSGKYYVSRAADPSKDQSYYLWDLPQAMLQRALTPMGNEIKHQIVASLPESDRARESMGVCFLRGRNYGDVLRERCRLEEGEIVDKHGNLVGTHDGYALYTIGQKRGMRLTEELGHTPCVTEIDAKQNRLTVGEDCDLHHTRLVVGGCNVVDIGELCASENVSVMIRGIGRNPEGAAQVAVVGDKPTLKLAVTLQNPAWAAAVGQPVVFYDGNRVLGGGYLEYFS